MYRKMRLDKYQTERNIAFEILKKSDFGVLSVTGDKGHPYGVAVNHVSTKNAIFFHCALKGHKIDAIISDPRVSFTAVSKVILHPEDMNTEYASAVVFGRASLISGAEKQEAMKLLLKKFSPGFLGGCGGDLSHTGVVKIEIDHISGKANYEGTV